MRSTPTEMQSMSENDFECFANTGVNTLGTMLPSPALTCDPFIPGPAGNDSQCVAHDFAGSAASFPRYPRRRKIRDSLGTGSEAAAIDRFSFFVERAVMAPNISKIRWDLTLRRQFRFT
jgi:hypothetical protein